MKGKAKHDCRTEPEMCPVYHPFEQESSSRSECTCQFFYDPSCKVHTQLEAVRAMEQSHPISVAQPGAQGMAELLKTHAPYICGENVIAGCICTDPVYGKLDISDWEDWAKHFLDVGALLPSRPIVQGLAEMAKEWREKLIGHFMDGEGEAPGDNDAMFEKELAELLAALLSSRAAGGDSKKGPA